MDAESVEGIVPEKQDLNPGVTSDLSAEGNSEIKALLANISRNTDAMGTRNEAIKTLVLSLTENIKSLAEEYQKYISTKKK